jgi:transcriptional antiterminator RfaH
MKRWYVLNSKPNKESLLNEQLCMHGIETYYPCLHVKPTNPRARKRKPYFPGYLFIHVDLESVGLSRIQWIPGARRLVAYGGDPAFISDELLQTIQRKVDEINNNGGEILCGVKPGDLIEISSGPFAGYRAIFSSHAAGHERVQVLLQMLQDRQICVELPGGQIDLIKQ